MTQWKSANESQPEAPPPGAATMNVIRWVLLAALVLLAVGATLWSLGIGPFHHGGGTGVLYRCPMHPSIVQDKPGNCPICGMTLVPFDPGQDNQPAPDASADGQPAQGSAGTHNDGDTGPAAPVTAATRYTCPMHPEVVSDKPGQCPKCGMDLVPEEVPATDAKDAKDTKAEAVYQCPMHPEVISDKPGKCPKCGMDLVPIEKPVAGTTHEDHTTEAAPEPLGPEHSELHLDENRVQMIGVKIGTAERRHLAGEIQTVARVSLDESRMEMVHSRVGGWIDRLLVSRVGDRVRAGQVIAQLHSFELINAQEDFLAATRNAEILKAASPDETERVMAAAHRRLRLLGMTDGEISRLGETGKVLDNVTVTSPRSGYVAQLNVLEGHEISAGSTIAVIGDLSRVWGLLDLYEFDLGRARPGQRVTLTFPTLPGRTFESKLDYVYPTVDERTRTTKARVVLTNADETLRPGMFGEATIAVEPREALVVPFDALMDNGRSRYVFVVRSPGVFVPTAVRVGLRTSDYVEILAGIDEGTSVVTSANFLLDSESRMLGTASGAM